jgi:hypothetical protein
MNFLPFQIRVAGYQPFKRTIIEIYCKDRAKKTFFHKFVQIPPISGRERGVKRGPQAF